jgi:hypothetical protein
MDSLRAVADCGNHLNQALDYALNSKTAVSVKVMKVKGSENYICSCRNKASFFFKVLPSGL